MLKSAVVEAPTSVVEGGPPDFPHLESTSVALLPPYSPTDGVLPAGDGVRTTSDGAVVQDASLGIEISPMGGGQSDPPADG
jgi:hypothetical protein